MKIRVFFGKLLKLIQTFKNTSQQFPIMPYEGNKIVENDVKIEKNLKN